MADFVFLCNDNPWLQIDCSTPQEPMGADWSGQLEAGNYAVDGDGDVIYAATEWQTPVEIAARFRVDVEELLHLNRQWYLPQILK